ncbi:MAG: pentapeptide repeat-containing protein [Pseudomonadota bacterium]
MDQSERLAQIEKIAQNARNTWFGLLVVLIFVGITLMGHQDSDFFAFGASTTLPVVNVDVPPDAFFLAAPVLTAALYCYLQVYLLGLWDSLGDLEQAPDAPALGDLVYPTIYTVAGLLYRDYRRNDACIPPRDLSRMTVIIAVLLGWVFGLVVLGWLWWRSAPAHNPAVTLIAGISFWAALMTAVISLMAAHRRMCGHSRAETARRMLRRQILGIAMLGVIGTLSWDRAGGGLIPWLDDTGLPVLMARADLYEAELSVRPADWLGFDLWVVDYQSTYAARQGLPAGIDSWSDEDRTAFQREAAQRWLGRTRGIGTATLHGADLRGADLSYAFLAGADMRGVDLTGASLLRAQMPGADLRKATLNDVDMRMARLEGAELSQAWMIATDLSFARLADVALIDAYLLEVEVNRTQMPRVDMRGAAITGVFFNRNDMTAAQHSFFQMQETSFNEVILDRVDFGLQDLTGFSLQGASLRGANFGSANLIGADLTGADLSLADLTNAELSGANLTGATFEETVLAGASLFSATLVKAQGLTQPVLDTAFGDPLTALPPGLSPGCHWPKEPVPYGAASSITAPPQETSYIDREAYDVLADSSTASLFYDRDQLDAWRAQGAIVTVRFADGKCP